MIQYTYKIRQLVTQDIGGQTKIVVKILYTVLGRDLDTGTEASIPDSADLVYSEGAEFTDFSLLTETQVLGWLNSVLDSSIVLSHQQRLQTSLSELNQQRSLNTTLITQLPWMPATDEPVADQNIIITNLDSLAPIKGDIAPPGCYLLNPDGTLKDPSELEA